MAGVSLLEERPERASRFSLATNEVLTDAEVLQYKDQSNVEPGLRFLTEPMLLASTLYKKAERVRALLWVRTLGSLVYAAFAHRIRRVLREHGATVPDPTGKPTGRPTARWVFELLMDVPLLFITQGGVQVQVMNLKDELRRLLKLLGVFMTSGKGGRNVG